MEINGGTQRPPRENCRTINENKRDLRILCSNGKVQGPATTLLTITRRAENEHKETTWNENNFSFRYDVQQPSVAVICSV